MAAYNSIGIVGGAEDEDDSFVYEEGDLVTIEGEDELDVRFRVRVLADLLTCPICGGFFRDAMTIKECLHTYCRSCILIKAHGSIDPACLKCGERIHGKLGDAIRQDLTIQNLVDKLFPQFAAREKQEKRELYKLCDIPLNDDDTDMDDATASTDNQNLHGNGGKSTSVISNGVVLPASATESLSTTVSPTAGSVPLPLSASCKDVTAEFLKRIASGCHRLDEHHDVHIILTPEEGGALATKSSAAPLARPHLRTSSQMQVHQLSRYLATKLDLRREDLGRLELLSKGQVLANSHTLEFACRSRRIDLKGSVPIQYRLLGPVSNKASNTTAATVAVL